MINLSIRLKTIASLVPNGARVCDVGTDHARLPIYLKQNNIANSVIATDLNEKPIENAKKNLLEHGVTDISLRHCDGLSAVESHEADTVIIAGMGGEVITGIIGGCDWLKNETKTLILQPTTSAEILRKFLCDNCFDIVEEIPLCENQKLYSIMLVRYNGIRFSFSEPYYYIGKIPRTPDGVLYIKKQLKRIEQCMLAFQNIENRKNDYLNYKYIYDEINNFLVGNPDVT